MPAFSPARRWLYPACGGGLLFVHTASAHLVTSGVGPFYDGIAHFFVSPDDLAVVIALALFGGLSGRAATRWLVLALPLAWLVGTLLGLRLPGPGETAWLPAGSMILCGLLVAFDPPVPAPVPAAVAAAVGAAHGVLNGRAMAASGTPFLAAIGIVAALGLVALILGAAISSLRAPWQRIAARALGSWVAAIGLLALAWTLRPAS